MPSAITSGLSVLVFIALLLAAPWQVSPLLAQETEPLPAAQAAPLHSTVDVATLPPPASGHTQLSVRPRRKPDPKGSRQWKDDLRELRQAVSVAPNSVEDAVPRVSVKSSVASVVFSFEGVTNNDNQSITGFPAIPPDPNLAVGPNHIFQVVNSIGRITDKSGGNPLTFSLRSFFQLDPGADESDPRVIYDAQSGRWFATYLQLALGGTSSIILAVSTTSNPTGTFCRYRLGNPRAETFIQDFPQLGVSSDKVVVGYDAFRFADDFFLGGGYYVASKADLLACASPSVVRVGPNSARHTVFPAHTLDGTSTLFMAMHASSFSPLVVLAIDGVPGVSTVTETGTSLAIRSWVAPPNADQLGSAVLLDTGDASVLSLALQNNSLWATGNEACAPPGDAQARSCLRVIEVRTNGPPSVRQDMTFGTSGQYYYYPALGPDSAGNFQIVFNASSASDFAGLRFTGRQSVDPLNTLQTSTLLRAGAGAQTHPSGRMGDYSGAALDPVDSRKVWVNGEYIRSTALSDWGTFVAQLSFPFPAQILSPTPGNTLAGSTATFGWSTGAGVAQYWLTVGSSVGGQDLYSQSQGTSLSHTVSGLPTDGRVLYVRLYFLINGAWPFNDYTYVP